MSQSIAAIRGQYASLEAAYHDAVAVHKNRWEDQLKSAQELLKSLKAKGEKERGQSSAGDNQIADTAGVPGTESSLAGIGAAAGQTLDVGHALSGLLNKGFVISQHNPRSTVRSILQR